MGCWTRTVAGIGSGLAALIATGSARAEDVCANLASPSANLTLINQVGQVAGTRILDHDATRILFASNDGVVIKSRADGTVTLIGPAMAATYGRLLADGAIWSSGRWRGGVLGGAGASAVNGDWAAIGPTTVENLATGDVTTVSRPAGSIADVFQTSSLDVSGLSGTLAFGGFVQPLGSYYVHTVTTAGLATVVSGGIFPILDGSHVAFTQHGGVVAWPASSVSTPSGIEILSSPSINFIGPVTGGPRPSFDYAVRGGWVAYTKLVPDGATETLEAWTRAPDGTRAKASTSTYVRLGGLNEAGEVVVDRHDRATRAFVSRSISKAEAAGPRAPLDLGAVRGDMRWVDGAWYEYIGCALFKVGPSAQDPNSGIPAAGADAGADAADAGDAGDADDREAGAPDAGASSSGGSSTSSGGGSSTSSSGGTSASGGIGASSGDGPSGGADDVGGGGGCTVGSSGTDRAVAITALLGLALVVARRRVRGRS